MTAIKGSVAMVTGGQRGIGKAFVEELLARGAKKVYATARRPSPSHDERVEVLALDVTDETSVAALAERAQDVDAVFAIPLPEWPTAVNVPHDIAAQVVGAAGHGGTAGVRVGVSTHSPMRVHLGLVVIAGALVAPAVFVRSTTQESAS